jgi:chromate reductase
MKIAAIVGSLRQKSFNRALAVTAGELIAERADFELLDYSSVPLFNEDIEYPAPKAVAYMRNKIKSADGIWFFTPEYNHLIPGVLKNFIDWLSRPVSKDEPQVLFGKKAAVSGASMGMGGTLIAQDNLVTLLSFLNVRVMNTPRLAIPTVLKQTDENGKLTLSESLPYLKKQADAFLTFILEG